MKKTKIIYWTSTILFAGFMGMSGITNILVDKEAVKLITGLGYPEYFIPFIGVAKLLGSVAILVPQFKKIKEWAYAGLFYDLIAATYSLVAINGFKPDIAFMGVFFSVGICSYIYNDKYEKLKTL